ncbi:MAG: metallophosphatase family protein [Lachnospiraceae bacterium]|nr:metallophosphatase family protein [Lachnospiraceae bacterium]
MSKVLFCSDIHGNMPAAEALEAEIERLKPDDIYFLGDAVGKGPESHKAVDWVQRVCRHAIKGNWDDSVCKSITRVTSMDELFYAPQIGPERLAWLNSLALEDEVLISGVWFRLVHGRPGDRLYQAYDSFAEMEEGFVSKVSNRTYGGYVCGDCHMPYVRESSKGYVVNCGSVGNNLGVPKVHAALIEGELGSTEPGTIRIQILSIPYDNRRAAALADEYPDMPNMEAYKHEVMTGEYVRRQ